MDRKKKAESALHTKDPHKRLENVEKRIASLHRLIEEREELVKRTEEKLNERKRLLEQSRENLAHCEKLREKLLFRIQYPDKRTRDMDKVKLSELNRLLQKKGSSLDEVLEELRRGDTD